MQEISKIKLDTLVAAYADLQKAAEEANNNLTLMKEVLTEAMSEEQIKTWELQNGGKIYRATFTQASVPIIDEAGLEKELGEQYDQFTKKVLDRKALESAMETGEVDPLKVGKHVTERKNKPSVRFTVRSAEDS